jgi:hypothetical protein
VSKAGLHPHWNRKSILSPVSSFVFAVSVAAKLPAGLKSVDLEETRDLVLTMGDDYDPDAFAVRVRIRTSPSCLPHIS